MMFVEKEGVGMRWITSGMVLIAAGLLASCNTISSHRLAGEDRQLPAQDSAGSYFLAKHAIEATITEKGITVTTKPIADTRTLINVGLRLSPLSSDDIKVEYSKDGLLKSITSSNDDKTGEIFKNVATSIGTFRSTNGSGRVKVSKITFDPFDPAEARAANELLSRSEFKGSCISVEVLPGVWSPGCTNNPFASARREKDSVPEPDDIAEALKAIEPGIYYRRTMQHRVFVSFKGQEFSTDYYGFANFAPILRVDVNRTLFVKRQTTIVFTDGALTSVQVEKPSEVAEITALPASLAGAYFDAVVSRLSKHQEVEQARANLLNAQASTLKNEQALLGAQADAAQRSTDFQSLGIDATDRATASDFSSFRRSTDLRTTYRNVAACQEALGLTLNECERHVRQLQQQ
jgi:predicted small secreted protein